MEDKAEAVVVCLDNSNYMRNEDYIPSRWGAQTQAVSWILNSMGVSHAFALLTMAGRRVDLLSPVITDTTALHQALDRANLGGECNLQASLQLAQMILRNRPSRCTSARVIVFSGSPVQDTVRSLTNIAKSYKKTNIALDVISFGDAHVDVLQELVNIVDNNDNSHFIESPPDDPTLSVSMINILLPDDNGILPQASNNSNNNNNNSNTRTEAEPPPVLRMPPPNRVCRRVVVDHTKYAAHRAASPPPSTLSLSLTLSLSSPRSDTSLQNNNNNNSTNTNNNSTSSRSGRDRDRLVLLVPFPSQRNKKVLVEFKAGRSQVAGGTLGGGLGTGAVGGTTVVRPVKRKGQLALLSINDDLFQFVWRDRATGVVDIDLLVHPREATFTRVPTHLTPARVYCLHVVETNKRHFFWMQHNDVEKDEEYCNIINSYLNHENTPENTNATIFMGGTGSPSSSNSNLSSSRQYHTLNAADLQQLLALYSLPLSFAARGNSRSSPSHSSSHSLTLRGARPVTGRSTLQPDADSPRRWIKNPIWMQNARARSAMERAGSEATRQSENTPPSPPLPPPPPPPPASSLPLLSPPQAGILSHTSSLELSPPVIPTPAALLTSPDTSNSPTPASPTPVQETTGGDSSTPNLIANGNLGEIVTRYDKRRKDSDEDGKS
jgi:26S proteasome regulatory subunit N10